MEPKPVQPGQKVRASDHNDVVRAIRSLRDRRAGTGVDSLGGLDSGLLTILSRQFPRVFRQGVIEAYSGPTPDTNGEVAVELITYHVRLRGGNHRFMENKKPDLGNPLPDGCLVKPAAAGDPCFILMLVDDLEGTPDPLLWVPLGPRGERFGVDVCGA